MNSSAKQFKIIRKINKHTIGDFFNYINKNETWNQIFSSDNVNEMFNSFLDMYLKIYYCFLFISSTLTYICNKSIAHGKFPDRLKYSEIKPLYKKGDK
jgi:hypothetical protein